MPRRNASSTVHVRGHARGAVVHWLILVVLIAAVAAFFALRGKGAAPEALAAAKAGEAKPTGPYELAASDVITVQRVSLSRTLPLSGTLRPKVQAVIKSRVGGEVLALNVREGETVQRGQVLARIDTRNAQSQVAAQQAALEKARADLALAKLNTDNNQRLLEKGFIAKNVLETSQSVYAASKAAERLAQAQLQQVQIGLADAVVRAPFSGIISRRSAEPGEKVSPDSPLLELVDLSKMELQAAVPASEVPSIVVGQQAKVRVDGYADSQFSGTVERINPTSEQGSRSIMLYLAVDNADARLRGGMFAQGELQIANTTQSLAVPMAAVHNDAGVSHVITVEAGKLVMRPVTLGLSTADAAMVEIKEGLKEGDTVIVAKLDSLKPGTEVVLKAPAPTTAAAR